MSFKAAFIFIAPEVFQEQNTHKFVSEAINLTVVGVSTYKEAVQVAKKLVEDGVGAIELCAGFGHEGVVEIKKAVNGKALVGVVRFDAHPGFNYKSGDEIFQ
jgi:hypothetical protein